MNQQTLETIEGSNFYLLNSYSILLTNLKIEKVKCGQRNAHIFAVEQLKEFLNTVPNKQLFEKGYQYLLKIASSTYLDSNLQEFSLNIVNKKSFYKLNYIFVNFIISNEVNFFARQEKNNIKSNDGRYN